IFAPIQQKYSRTRMLLLSPQRLQKDGIIFQSFEVIKTPKSVDFKAHTLEPYEVRKKFSTLPKETRDGLLLFNKNGMLGLEAELRSRHAAQRSGKPFDDFYAQAKLRELHASYYRLLPDLSGIKNYHKVRNADGKFRTAPCTLCTDKPALSFSLNKANDRIGVVVTVDIGGVSSPLSAFNRYEFLIEKEDHYYQLAYRDYQTVEWLESTEIRT